MRKHLLITGGAGFIGFDVAEEMLQYGYRVRVLDNLSLQVHGEARKRPEYLSRQTELIVGDIRDPATVDRALNGVDAVYHFVAAVGVGQSTLGGLSAYEHGYGPSADDSGDCGAKGASARQATYNLKSKVITERAIFATVLPTFLWRNAFSDLNLR